MEDDGGVDCLLWENSGILVSILLSSGARIAASTFRVLVLDQESATFELTNRSIPFSLVFDLRSTVTRQVISSSEGLLSYKFFYDRFDHHAEIEFIFCGPDDHRDETSRNLEFVLRQYTLYTTEGETFSEERQRPNVVAKGLEGVGVGFRTALKSGGRSTGDAIRSLGRMYTSSTIGDTEYRVKRVTTQSQIQKAERRLAKAETCNAATRTVTSAALTPARWIGKTTLKLTPKTRMISCERGVARVVHDTVGGMGNGIANVYKVCLRPYLERNLRVEF